MIRRLAPSFTLAMLGLLAGCANARQAEEMHASGTSSTAVAMGEWRSLVNPAISAWRGYKSPSLPSGWRVENGVLMKDTIVADLLSREQFEDFELAFDWKVARGGNAGVFYRVTEEYDRPYWSGPEYQLLDDALHADGRSRLRAAGAAYGLFPAPAGIVKPGGEWNAARIISRGNHV
ncbi:MAG: DUF1080 domain-containing protein, partial [Gemmatimonadaceae bacterium]|nr:DUF1080 domain-containing protein [Gemmatimonadaceae bacterium]